jgi:hypothetical protein
LGTIAYPGSTIDFVSLTHGHLDHWLLPRLVDQGFMENLLQRTDKGNCKTNSIGQRQDTGRS